MSRVYEALQKSQGEVRDPRPWLQASQRLPLMK